MSSWRYPLTKKLVDDGGFPFDSYEQVLDEITLAAGAQGGMKALDLGVGTGNLVARFADLVCDIWGLDFSAEMLAKAQEKLSQPVFVRADLLRGWPTKLEHRFDRIVSVYLLHEFDLTTKVKLLVGLTERYLAAERRIVVGDIAFPTSVCGTKHVGSGQSCGMMRSTTG